MNVGVIGMGHLANVMSVCLAGHGHHVRQYDDTPFLLRADHVPMEKEPGWATMCAEAAPKREILEEPDGLSDSEIFWIAYDTPLDARGGPNVQAVVDRILSLRTSLPVAPTILLSSQWPVGTTRQLEEQWPAAEFVYIPENIRAGKALGDFFTQGRIIVGTRTPLEPSGTIMTLLSCLSTTTIQMSVESAEMSKHALNAFLALQIAFINEIARLCEAEGAKSGDVATALLTDSRISPNAYLRPGKPFAGGSLQRDLVTLQTLAKKAYVSVPILKAIIPSNAGR